MNRSFALDQLAVGGSPPADSEYRISLVLKQDLDGLTDFLPQLEALADEALEPNVFYEPWMLLPALECYAKNHSLSFLLVLATDPSDDTPRVCGFFPLEAREYYRGLPLRNFTLWRHPHCFLATPLVHRRFAEYALRGLVSWFQSESRYSLMVFNEVSAQSELHRQFGQIMAATSLKAFEQPYERAFLRTDRGITTYPDSTLSPKPCKNYRRRLRQLSACGELRWHSLESTEDIDGWIRDFLQLEGSGWKGRSGTALQSSEADTSFFRKMAINGHERGRLLMLALRLDDKPIAMNVVLLSGGGGFAFKIAYDENYRRYAPGVLLRLELFQRLLAGRELAWLDTCADPDCELANRLCPDRRPICNLIIAKPNTLGAGMLNLLPTLSQVKKHLVNGDRD